MTGRPAWEFRLTEDELWAIVAFIRTMPTLAPVDYERRRARVLGAADDEEAP